MVTTKASNAKGEGEAQGGAHEIEPDMGPGELRQLAPGDCRSQKKQPGAESVPEHVSEIREAGVTGDLVDWDQQTEIDAGDEDEDERKCH